MCKGAGKIGTCRSADLCSAVESVLDTECKRGTSHFRYFYPCQCVSLNSGSHFKARHVMSCLTNDAAHFVIKICSNAIWITVSCRGDRNPDDCNGVYWLWWHLLSSSAHASANASIYRTPRESGLLGPDSVTDTADRARLRHALGQGYHRSLQSGTSLGRQHLSNSSVLVPLDLAHSAHAATSECVAEWASCLLHVLPEAI